MRELIEEPALLIDRLGCERLVGLPQIPGQRRVTSRRCHAREIEHWIAAAEPEIPGVALIPVDLDESPGAVAGEPVAQLDAPVDDRGVSYAQQLLHGAIGGERATRRPAAPEGAAKRCARGLPGRILAALAQREIHVEPESLVAGEGICSDSPGNRVARQR